MKCPQYIFHFVPERTICALLYCLSADSQFRCNTPSITAGTCTEPNIYCGRWVCSQWYPTTWDILQPPLLVESTARWADGLKFIFSSWYVHVSLGGQGTFDSKLNEDTITICRICLSWRNRIVTRTPDRGPKGGMSQVYQHNHQMQCPTDIIVQGRCLTKLNIM
jgi:hypothetical protein